MQLLLVEDDALLGDGIKEGLLDAGFVVEWLTDGQNAWHVLSQTHQFDAVVLDINLPRMDGLTLLRQLRGKGDAVPVILLTARSEIEQRIEGLNCGADDYLPKPFALGELTARLHALLRRSHGHADATLRWRNLSLNPGKQQVLLDNQHLELTATEYRLLYLLMANAPHYLSRPQLEEKLFGWQSELESNSLDVHLSHLRKKLGNDTIRNQRGLGWRMGEA
ncbi:response regulator transcription factor [Chitinilyticum piscinae]|uniref:Response regulator transcription factor n=1 Tax=Chitinilyticum piscinae TaxID=2866724 RepID=A0A8J7FFA6_9NEIS|nr:response regulator transcription factor [Chitinilyticum piscinae]MBE9607960.1 response regulator transcription factor [Chitinilyticum piscinae]